MQRSQAGFTLVEVVMAMAIVVVGVVGMMQAVTLGSESLDTARKQRIAAQVVQGEVEHWRISDWSDISGLPATATVNVSASGVLSGATTNFALTGNTALIQQIPGFSCTLTRTVLRTNYLKLVYVVSWTSSAGRKHSRQFESYYGKNGLHLTYQQS